MWSQLSSRNEEDKIRAARSLLEDPTVKPAWIFEAFGPKPWGASLEVTELWLAVVKRLPREYPLAKHGGLRALLNVLDATEGKVRDVLAQCLDTLVDLDAALIDQAITVVQKVGGVSDALTIASVRFLTTALIRSRAKKSFEIVLDNLPRVWHLDTNHLHGMFELLFAEPQGFKKIEGLKKQKLTKDSRRDVSATYHTGFFALVKENRHDPNLLRLLPHMLRTFLVQWRNRKASQTPQADELHGTKRLREELKAKFDPGFFFFEMLYAALVESNPSDDWLECVNELWRVCASCNAFRKDTEGALLKTYASFLVNKQPKDEHTWHGLTVCLSLDSSCLEMHFLSLWPQLSTCPPSFPRALVQAYALLHDLGSLLTSLLDSDTSACVGGLKSALRDALTTCLPGQMCDLLKQLASKSWAEPLLTAVLEGQFAVQEQTAQDVDDLICSFTASGSPRFLLAQQAALRRLAQWTGSPIDKLKFRTPSSSSTNRSIEERLTIQLHRVAQKKRLTDMDVFQEAHWELVRPHLPLLATVDGLRSCLRKRLTPADLLVAFETEIFREENESTCTLQRWATKACKDVAFAREMPVELLAPVETILERKWADAEKLEILERLQPSAERRSALAVLGKVAKQDETRGKKLTRAEALKLPCETMGMALLAAKGKWTEDELQLAWSKIKDNPFTFRDLTLLNELLLKTRKYRRQWTTATRICLHLGMWSSDAAQVLLLLFRLPLPRGGQPPWVKMIPAVLACVRKITESAYQAPSGEEALKRARETVRVWQVVSNGSVRWAPSVGYKRLQQALRKYIGLMVASFLDVDRKFVGADRAAHDGSREEIARWKEAQKILQQGLLPLMEMMEERQKQALFTQLQEPLKSMFRDAHAGFKKHGFYTGKY
eukprot:GEMP01016655.1.p1 GENE.GEMP01016655.1~~GEMP01016655.1.p1  ORF type:complete len:890 (+),score=238.46 GEMP01016655.1:133-2802(+)